MLLPQGNGSLKTSQIKNEKIKSACLSIISFSRKRFFFFFLSIWLSNAFLYKNVLSRTQGKITKSAFCSQPLLYEVSSDTSVTTGQVLSQHPTFLLIYPHPFLRSTPSVLEQELLQLTQLPLISSSPTDCFKRVPCEVLHTKERSHRSDGWQQAFLLIWDKRMGFDAPPWRGCCRPRGSSKGTKPRDRHILPFGRGTDRAGGL